MKWIIIILLVLIFNSFAHCQENKLSDVSVMFYNVENLFDLENNPHTNDDEFTPKGARRWNFSRLNAKINNIAKVIISANNYKLPDIVALCEVENLKVLELLCNNSPLKSANYNIIHKDSPDARGIDIAILYRETEYLRPISYKYHAVTTSNGDTINTREILEAKFAVFDDTLNVIANHWPSRYSGQLETDGKRINAANTLLGVIDNLREKDFDAKIVITGDFNDEPNDNSLMILTANSKLHNLSKKWQSNSGTLKYGREWNIFDQIIISDSLFEKNKVFFSGKITDARIVKLPFLFEKDQKWGGLKLFRTYHGYKYTGGFSDHLPVIINLKY